MNDFDKGREQARHYRATDVMPYPEPAENDFQRGWNAGLREMAQNMTWKGTAWAVKVPPGLYFLGDPAYAVAYDKWEALLKDADHFDSKPAGKVDGQEVLAFNAPDVPGRFRDDAGYEYLCDTGLLGLVPAALVGTDQQHIRKLTGLGRFTEFDQVTLCVTDGKTWVFGNVTLVEDQHPYEDEGR